MARPRNPVWKVYDLVVDGVTGRQPLPAALLASDPGREDEPMAGLLSGWRSQLSKTPDGKWRGDLFDGEADMPDAFFVMSGSRDAALERMRQKWPYAEQYVVVPCDMCEGSGTDDDGDGCSTCDGEAEIAVPYLSTI